ncbi:AAA family ATPase [Saccharolobus caldissimus]|uniref:ATPase AAA n=1 Tax=Saccharolobus caldissimus TaxID=1702097 RepID=A0AAQ4CSC2_9CREN|nr:ATP-binding protein [Saccharolobus caldissimus]BDB98703.1 ATPase AAA [Saccharolobus caldissimus]
MLFDVRPKEDRKDLYDRDKEIDEIKESVERKVWIAVYGMRRVGKTSVVNVAVNDPKYLVIKLNLMRIYNPKKKRYPKSSFISLFLESINEVIKKYTLGGRLTRLISNILGIDENSFIEFNLVKIRARLKRFRGDDVNSVVRELDLLAGDNKKTLILIFDEAQELMKVNGINFSSIFHDIYDYCKNTTVVFTGSSAGILENMLKSLEYEKPFFGRFIRRIRIEKFDERLSRDFLLKGFEEEGVKVTEDVIEKALKRFDGIPGWLTFFGSEYSFRVKHGEKADVEIIEKMAIEEVRKEIRDFILGTQSPERYSATILALDRLGGKGSVAEVTKVVNTILEEVPEPRIYEILNRLVDMGFIEKVGDEYFLPKDEPNRKGLVLASKDVLASPS